MADVLTLTYNSFKENTYVIYDKTGECVVIDPGCNSDAERADLLGQLEQHNLKPVRLINTHCHIDHVFGNKFIADKYNLPLEIHRGEIPVLEAVPMVCKMYGVPYTPSPDPEKFIEEGDIIRFGETSLETLFTPGHSPASISFYCKESDFVIAGDVLFMQSIGRTDLPGGNFDTLINSIRTKLFPLGDTTKVYPGHGPATTIGYEKVNNPVLK